METINESKTIETKYDEKRNGPLHVHTSFQTIFILNIPSFPPTVMSDGHANWDHLL